MKRFAIVLCFLPLLFCIGWAQLPLGLPGDIRPTSDFSVTNGTLQSAYLFGEDIVLTLHPNKAANVVIISISPSGKSCLLFPSKLYPQLQIPNISWPFSIGRAGTVPFDEAGTYTLQALYSVSTPDMFTDWLERAKKAPGYYYFFDKPLTDEMILSRMVSSGEWGAAVFSFTITIQSGELEVVTYPSASVYIDDALVGASPLSASLPIGIHRLQVELEGYRTHTEEVYVGVTKTTKLVTLEPSRGTEEVSVDSLPQGVEVWLDGKKIGKTPLKTQVGFGEHVLKIDRDGYYTVTKIIEVISGHKVAIDETLRVINTLGSKTASVTLVVNPAEAVVKIDGIEQRSKILQIKAGTHVTEASLKGYRTEKQLINLVEGSTQTVYITLSKEMAVMKVKTEGVVASVFVNGIFKAFTPMELNLPEGRYYLTLVAPNYRTITKEVTLRIGQVVELNEKMSPIY